ncbi:MAG: xylanase [Niastella sp.]|nr:xylanase [Niastella sp.]
MMIKHYFKGLLATGFLIGGGQAGAQSTTAPLTLTIDTRTTFQTIDNFSASDAWAGQFVGLWPDAKKDSIADWLFSLDTLADGSPKGIGLSMWRFNLGGGSTQQGDSSGIRDEWRRAESFIGADGQFDFNRQAGQQWFLKAAKQRGVPQFLIFLNSPPVQYTNNQKAYTQGGKCNIEPAVYGKVSDYIVRSIEGLQKKNGICIQYISPVNEPQWDWSDGGQEGNPYNNTQIAGLVRTLNDALVSRRLPAKILVTEAGHLKYLLRDEDKPGKGNQVQDLMDPTGANYIGGLKAVSNTIAGHSYFSTSPFRDAITLRQELARRVASVKGLSYWQSEYCILGDNGGEINGSRRDTGMQSALYVARTIHTDLAIANATAWQWWLSISPYNYKDGLVYIDKSKTGGQYQDSKLMWALGNYSRFIRPGMQRIAATLVSPDSTCLATAYKDVKTGTVVAVLINTARTTQTVQVNEHTGKAFTRARAYVTSPNKKLQPQSVNNTLLLEPESVTTLVIASPRKK